MAYVDFSPESLRLNPVFSRVVAEASAREAVRFTADELRVIDLAEHFDATREFSPRSPIGRFAEWAFGLRTDRPLASERLEQLRRFASLAYHHPDRVEPEHFDRLVDAGFSEGQAAGLLAHIAQRRSRRH